MSLLDWQDGLRPHAGDLQRFTCTDWKKPARVREWPPKGDYPGWWEYEVQCKIRNFHPPFQSGRHLRLGFDAEGLAAVYSFQELDGVALIEWEYAGLAMRLRHKGGGYADDMFLDLVDELTSLAMTTETTLIVVQSNIWQENAPSQSMVRRHGFEHIADRGNGVQVWEHEVPVAL